MEVWCSKCDVSCIYYTRKGSQWRWPGFRSKSRRLCGWLLRRVVVWSERASRIQAFLWSLWIVHLQASEPNQKGAFASVLVFPQMLWGSLDSANDSDDCEHVVKWSILRYRDNLNHYANPNSFPMKGRRSAQQDGRAKTSSTRPGGERRKKGWLTWQSFGERSHAALGKRFWSISADLIPKRPYLRFGNYSNLPSMEMIWLYFWWHIFT